MSISKSRIVSLCLTGLLLSVPASVFAGADSGFYIGAGAGDASVDGSDSGFDESDTAYKVFAGYNIGFIPLVDFAVEASYVDFGSPGTNNVSVDTTGINAFGLAGLSFGPFGIFAKAGMIDWDMDINAGSGAESKSGTDPAYGVGARFALGAFSVRAEYELYDLDNADVDMVSVSAAYTF